MKQYTNQALSNSINNDDEIPGLPSTQNLNDKAQNQNLAAPFRPQNDILKDLPVIPKRKKDSKASYSEEKKQHQALSGQLH